MVEPEVGGQIVWAKKVERDSALGKRVIRDSRQLEAERLVELERVRARRAQNEAEWAQRQEDIGDLERMRLAAEAAKEAAKEEQFHLRQTIGRAHRRLDEGRARAIDRLIQVVHLQDTHPFAGDDFRPHTLLDGLRVDELEDLMSEVQLFRDLDVEDADNAAYWLHVMDLMRRRVSAERDAESADRAALGSVAGPLVRQAGGAELDPVSEMVEAALGGTLEELLELEKAVDEELASPACPDPAFWQAVRPRISQRKAEYVLNGVFQRKRAAAKVRAAGGCEDAVLPSGSEPRLVQPAAGPPSDDEGGAEIMPEWMRLSDGRLSPPPVAQESCTDAALLLEEDQDRELLLLMRQQVHREAEQLRQADWVTSTAAPDPGTTNESNADTMQIAQAQAAMGMTGGDAMFQALVPLEAREYWWREKHKPRCPKFFNKVHTGYDWNKYNRAHYDVDNPPPKVVQGYKFNIFYPDLLDPSIAPVYKLMDDPSGDDATRLLVFVAGPPYEDIAFRIVNKEWDRGPKKGFKAVFDRGMLQLYFNFRRTPYKR